MCENLGIDLGLEVLSANNQDEGDTAQKEVTEKLQSLALQNGNTNESPATFDDEFPLVNVNASVFKKIIEWCEEHYGEEMLCDRCKYFRTSYGKFGSEIYIQHTIYILTCLPLFVHT